MAKILSNERWFKTYVWIRNIIILGLAITILTRFIIDIPPLWLGTLRGVFFSFFLLVIIFEFLQKPGYLNVWQLKNGDLSIEMYLPDTGLFFYFDRKRIRQFIVKTEDRLELLGVLKQMPWQQKLQIVVSKPNGETFKSEVLDVSWARKKDLKRFYEVAKGFPN